MSGGVKHDEGKLRFDLLPVRPLRELARVASSCRDPRGWAQIGDATPVDGAVARSVAGAACLDLDLGMDS